MITIHRWPILAACAVLSACGQGEESAADVAVPAGVQAAAPPPAFAVCSSCHAVVPGRSGSGPNLAGVYGRKAGTLPGYPYSAALKGSGIVWDRERLDRWLEAPMTMVPGTKMVLGIPNPEARRSVIDYLETLTPPQP